jgi:hypothetical protein
MEYIKKIEVTDEHDAVEENLTIFDDLDSMQNFLHAEIRYLMDLVTEGVFPLSWAGKEAQQIEDMLLKGEDLTIEEVLEYMVEMQSRTYHHLHYVLIEFKTSTKYSY